MDSAAVAVQCLLKVKGLNGNPAHN